jgi:hypothetical protein
VPEEHGAIQSGAIRDLSDGRPFVPVLHKQLRGGGLQAVTRIRCPSTRRPRQGRRDAVPTGRRAGARGCGAPRAVGDEGVPIRKIAEAIGRHLNLPARSLPPEDWAYPQH